VSTMSWHLIPRGNSPSLDAAKRRAHSAPCNLTECELLRLRPSKKGRNELMMAFSELGGGLICR